MNGLPGMIVYVAQIMDLGMAVVTWCNTVSGFSRQNLFGFELAVATTRLRISCLEKSSSSTTAIIVRPVRMHVNKILFTHHRFYGISQVLGHRISKAFADQLAGVLHRKLNLQILVPVGIDLQLSLFDPLGIILNDAFDLKLRFNIEFFQSGPDCKKFVPSLGIEPDLTLEVLHGFGLDLYNMFPGIIISKKHAVVFRRPSFGAVCPVGAYQVKNLP
jgi:hypothetical protein